MLSIRIVAGSLPGHPSLQLSPGPNDPETCAAMMRSPAGIVIALVPTTVGGPSTTPVNAGKVTVMTLAAAQAVANVATSAHVVLKTFIVAPLKTTTARSRAGAR